MIPSSLLLLLLHAPPQFTRVEEADGVLVEARAVPGSPLAELRLTTSTRKTPESLCAAAFGTGKLDPEEPELTSRKVLYESEDERVTYDQMRPPLVSARDYVSRVKRFRADDTCRVTFEPANELAPAKREGWVRVSKFHGEWKFERAPEGVTRVTYVVYSDPGGALPPVLVEGSRRKIALRWVKMILRRGRE